MSTGAMDLAGLSGLCTICIDLCIACAPTQDTNPVRPHDSPLDSALLVQMLAVRHLAPLEPTGQQRVAVLIGHIGEVLAGHTDPCGPGPLQPINEVPFLFSHRTLLSSTSVLVQVDWKWEGEKYGSRLKRRPPLDPSGNR